MAAKRRIGVLTSGGDAPGLNAVIRGVVKSANQLGYDCVGFLRGYEGLVEPVGNLRLRATSTGCLRNDASRVAARAYASPGCG